MNKEQKLKPPDSWHTLLETLEKALSDWEQIPIDPNHSIDIENQASSKSQKLLESIKVQIDNLS